MQDTIKNPQPPPPFLNFGEWKIDSLNINLSDKVTNQDSTLLQERFDGLYRVDSETGDIIHFENSHTRLKNEGQIKGKGYHFNYSVGKNIHGNYLALLATSKVLEDQVFNGFTLSNVDRVVEAVNTNLGTSYNVSDFLSARVTNVDVCMDINSEGYKDQLDFTKALYNCYQPKTLNGNHDNTVIRELNNAETGSQFKDSTGYQIKKIGKRSQVLFRGYDKPAELKSRGHKFLSATFGESNATKIVNLNWYRFEYNLTKSRDVARIVNKGMNSCTLGELLQAIEHRQADFNKAFVETLNRYHDMSLFEIPEDVQEERKKKEYPNLSENDEMYLKVMYRLADRDIDYIIQEWQKTIYVSGYKKAKQYSLNKKLKQARTYLEVYSKPVMKIVHDQLDADDLANSDVMIDKETSKARIKNVMRSFGFHSPFSDQELLKIKYKRKSRVEGIMDLLSFDGPLKEAM